MKRTICALAVLALTLTACGGGGAGTTPEDTFESARNVIKNKNWEAICDLMPPSELKKSEEEFEKGKEGPGAAMLALMLGLDAEKIKTMTFREFMGKMIEKMAEKEPEKMEEMLAAEITDTKIEGDKATITTKSGDKEEKINLVKENGRWYMADFAN